MTALFGSPAASRGAVFGAAASMLCLLLTLPVPAAAAALQLTPTPEGCASFSAWRQAHGGKLYEAEHATERAQENWRSNCARYQALNSVQGGATFGADEHADLAPNEFAARFGGCLHEDERWQSTAESRSASPRSLSVAGRGRVDKTPTIDWRTKGQVTHVKNQGAFGTCWSFGVAENLEGLNVRQGHALVNISEQELISCCPQCQGRSQDISLGWLLNTTGGQPALEASYPYVGKPGVCRKDTAPRAPVKLHSWGRVQDDGSGAPVSAALLAHGPMGMGVDATCFQGYKHGIIRNCSSKGIDHAVLMVAAGEDQDVPYFTIKNSWGAKWGEHGFVRIEQAKDWWGNISVIFLK